ncbi:equilibrative nucleobase transporter 1-like, partial [Amphiura filiformis]|uniref:equilibrative nucleobase transporter 1-like n=1 Tax=Amphiura filiformis TaxID=82378 RepID=UPI003B21E390
KFNVIAFSFTLTAAARLLAEHYRNKDYPNLKSCIFSPAFGLLAFWLSTLQLKAVYYVGTLNPYLVQITDGNEDQISHFTEVFCFIQFGGVLASPLGGSILDRNKGLPNRQAYDDVRDNVLGFTVTSSLFILFSICNIIPVLEVQYITFILQVVTRSFLYGILVSSIANTFPSQYYGSLIGFNSGIGAVMIVIQYPLFIITQKVFNNDPLIVNAFLLVACVTTLVVPVYFYFYAKRKNAEVDQLRQSPQNINEPEVKKSTVFTISGLQ